MKTRIKKFVYNAKKYFSKKLHQRIITKYILKSLFVSLLAMLFVLTGIAWLSQILRLISFMVSSRISIFSFMYFTMLLLPTILTVVLPITVFAVILFVYNKLISDKEMVVMQSTGIGIRLLVRPAIIFIFVITILTYYLVMYLSPAFYLKFRDYKFKITNSVVAMFIKEGEFTEVSKGLTLYIKEAKKDVLLDVFINDARKPDNPRTVMAEQGQLIDTTDGVKIVLVNGNVQEKRGGNYAFGYFENYTVDMGLSRSTKEVSYKPKDLFLNQLFYAKKLGYANDKNFNEYKLEVHKRFITPLYSLVFGLIALVALLRSSLNRRANNVAIFMSILCMGSLQSFYIIFFEVIKKYYFLWPLLYIITVGIIAFLSYMLFSDRFAMMVLRRRRSKFYKTKIGKEIKQKENEK